MAAEVSADGIGDGGALVERVLSKKRSTVEATVIAAQVIEEYWAASSRIAAECTSVTWAVRLQREYSLHQALLSLGATLCSGMPNPSAVTAHLMSQMEGLPLADAIAALREEVTAHPDHIAVTHITASGFVAQWCPRFSVARQLLSQVAAVGAARLPGVEVPLCVAQRFAGGAVLCWAPLLPRDRTPDLRGSINPFSSVIRGVLAVLHKRDSLPPPTEYLLQVLHNGSFGFAGTPAAVWQKAESRRESIAREVRAGVAAGPFEAVKRCVRRLLQEDAAFFICSSSSEEDKTLWLSTIVEPSVINYLTQHYSLTQEEASKTLQQQKLADHLQTGSNDLGEVHSSFATDDLLAVVTNADALTDIAAHAVAQHEPLVGVSGLLLLEARAALQSGAFEKAAATVEAHFQRSSSLLDDAALALFLDLPSSSQTACQRAARALRDRLWGSSGTLDSACAASTAIILCYKWRATHCVGGAPPDEDVEVTVRGVVARTQEWITTVAEASEDGDVAAADSLWRMMEVEGVELLLLSYSDQVCPLHFLELQARFFTSTVASRASQLLAALSCAAAELDAGDRDALWRFTALAFDTVRLSGRMTSSGLGEISEALPSFGQIITVLFGYCSSPKARSAGGHSLPLLQWTTSTVGHAVLRCIQENELNDSAVLDVKRATALSYAHTGRYASAFDVAAGEESLSADVAAVRREAAAAVIQRTFRRHRRGEVAPEALGDAPFELAAQDIPQQSSASHIKFEKPIVRVQGSVGLSELHTSILSGESSVLGDFTELAVAAISPSDFSPIVQLLDCMLTPEKSPFISLHFGPDGWTPSDLAPPEVELLRKVEEAVAARRKRHVFACELISSVISAAAASATLPQSPIELRDSAVRDGMLPPLVDALVSTCVGGGRTHVAQDSPLMVLDLGGNPLTATSLPLLSRLVRDTSGAVIVRFDATPIAAQSEGIELLQLQQKISMQADALQQATDSLKQGSQAIVISDTGISACFRDRAAEAFDQFVTTLFTTPNAPETLDLSANVMGDTALRRLLAAVEANDAIVYCDVSGNPGATEELCAQFECIVGARRKRLKVFKQLKSSVPLSINLSQCCMKRSHLRRLIDESTATSLTIVRHIDLSNNPALGAEEEEGTVDDLAVLMSATPLLQSLSIEGCGFSAENLRLQEILASVNLALEQQQRAASCKIQRWTRGELARNAFQVSLLRRKEQRRHEHLLEMLAYALDHPEDATLHLGQCEVTDASLRAHVAECVRRCCWIECVELGPGAAVTDGALQAFLLQLEATSGCSSRLREIKGIEACGRLSEAARVWVREALAHRCSKIDAAAARLHDALEALRGDPGGGSPMKFIDSLDLRDSFLLASHARDLVAGLRSAVTSNKLLAIGFVDLRGNSIRVNGAAPLVAFMRHNLGLCELRIDDCGSTAVMSTVERLNTERGRHKIFFRGLCCGSEKDKDDEAVSRDSLDFSGLALADSHAALLASCLPSLLHIRNVDVADNSLSDRGVQQLANACMSTAPQVHYIDLTGNPGFSAEDELTRRCFSVLEQRRQAFRHVQSAMDGLSRDSLVVFNLEKLHVSPAELLAVPTLLRSSQKIRHVNLRGIELSASLVAELQDVMRTSKTLLSLELDEGSDVVMSPPSESSGHSKDEEQLSLLAARAGQVACRIQSCFRGFQARKELKRLREKRSVQECKAFTQELLRSIDTNFMVEEEVDASTLDLDGPLLHQLITEITLRHPNVTAVDISGGDALPESSLKSMLWLLDPLHINVMCVRVVGNWSDDIGDARRLMFEKFFESRQQIVSGTRSRLSEFVQHVAEGTSATLDLNSSRVNDTTVALLSNEFSVQSSQLPHLFSIDLSHNGITNAGAHLLLQLMQSTPALTGITLDGTPYITDQQLLAQLAARGASRRDREIRFASALNHFQLAKPEKLTLSDFELCDHHAGAIVDTLRGATFLRSIDLSGNAFSEIGLDAIFHEVDALEAIVDVHMIPTLTVAPDSRSITQFSDCVAARRFRHSVLPQKIKELSMLAMNRVDMSGLRLTNTDLCGICSVLCAACHIASISFANNLLTDAAVGPLLLAVTSNSSIKFVDMSGNSGISVEAMSGIAKVCQQRNGIAAALARLTETASSGAHNYATLDDLMITDDLAPVITAALRVAGAPDSLRDEERLPLRFLTIRGAVLTPVAALGIAVSALRDCESLELLALDRNVGLPLDSCLRDDPVWREALAVLSLRAARHRAVRAATVACASRACASVQLRSLRVTDAQIEHLLRVLEANASSLPQLKRVVIGGNPLSQVVGNRLLAIVRTCPTIEEVHCFGCEGISASLSAQICRRAAQNKEQNEAKRHAERVRLLQQPRDDIAHGQRLERIAIANAEREEFASITCEAAEAVEGLHQLELNQNMDTVAPTPETEARRRRFFRVPPVRLYDQLQQQQQQQEKVHAEANEGGRIASPDAVNQLADEVPGSPSSSSASPQDGGSPTSMARKDKKKEFNIHDHRREANRKRRQLRAEMLKKSIMEDDVRAARTTEGSSSYLSSEADFDNYSSAFSQSAPGPEAEVSVVSRCEATEMIEREELTAEEGAAAAQLHGRLAVSLAMARISDAQHLLSRVVTGALSRVALHARWNLRAHAAVIAKCGRGHFCRLQLFIARRRRVLMLSIVHRFMHRAAALRKAHLIHLARAARRITCIQAHLRSAAVALLVQRWAWRDAQRCIAPVAAGYSARRALARRRWAVALLARAARGFAVRCEVGFAAWRWQLEAAAATAIQRVYRGFRARAATGVIQMARADAVAALRKAHHGLPKRASASMRLATRSTVERRRRPQSAAVSRAAGRRTVPIAPQQSLPMWMVMPLQHAEYQAREALSGAERSEWARIARRGAAGRQLAEMLGSRHLALWQEEKFGRDDINLVESVERASLLRRFVAGCLPTALLGANEAAARKELIEAWLRSVLEMHDAFRAETVAVEKRARAKAFVDDAADVRGSSFVGESALSGLSHHDEMLLSRVWTSRIVPDVASVTSAVVPPAPVLTALIAARREPTVDGWKRALSAAAAAEAASEFGCANDAAACKAAIYHNLAAALCRAQQYRAALEAAKAAVDAGSKAGESALGESKTLINLASIHVAMGNGEEALTPLRRAMALLVAAGVEDGMNMSNFETFVTALHNLASAQAVSLFERARATATLHAAVRLSASFLGVNHHLTKSLRQALLAAGRQTHSPSSNAAHANISFPAATFKGTRHLRRMKVAAASASSAFKAPSPQRVPERRAVSALDILPPTFAAASSRPVTASKIRRGPRM